MNPHDLGAGIRVLDRHDRVGSVRNRAAGHDANRSARTHGNGCIRVRADISDHPQTDRSVVTPRPDIGCANRVAIHRTVVRGRNIALRNDVLAQDAVERVVESDFFGIERGDFAEHALLRLLDGDDRFPLTRPLKRSHETIIIARGPSRDQGLQQRDHFPFDRCYTHH